MTKSTIHNFSYQVSKYEVIANLYFSEPDLNLDLLDLPVNAVATALKDFFSKKLPPLLDEASMAQLEDIAGNISKL